MKNLTSSTWIKKAIRGLIVFTFLLCSYLLLTTEKGLEIAIQFSKHALPGTLKIAAVNGCLLGPIQIKQLEYANATTQLAITQAKLDWHWSSLLKGQLNLGPLFIDKLNLFIKENDSAKKTKPNQISQLIKIFNHLRFSHITINQINIHTGTFNLVLQGSLHDQWLINWQLNIPQLQQMAACCQGKLVLAGKIIGPKFSPEFYAVVHKTNVLWQDYQLQQVQAVFDVNANTNKKWQLNITAAAINHKKIKLTPLQLKFSGYLDPFSLIGTLSEFKLKQISTQSNPIVMPSVQISSRLAKQQLETTILTTKQEKNNQLVAHLLLPNFQINSCLSKKQVINARVVINLKDLAFLSDFVPKLTSPQGKIDAQCNAAGTIFSPTLNLTANLKNGKAKIPYLGLDLNNIQLHLNTDKTKLLGNGQLSLGKGSLKFNTITQLTKKLSTIINLTGNDIAIIQTPEYKILASPNLNIQADTQQIKILGNILFPAANIKINPDNANLADLSSDISFVGDNKKSTISHFNLNSNINIQLGNEIYFQYKGLKTQLKGSLAITQTANQAMLATGQLKLFNGKYTYYGQSLTIQPNSSLNFANTPIENPKLDLTASRNVLIIPNISPQNQSAKDMKSTIGSTDFIQSSLQSSQTTPVQTIIGVHLQGYLQNPHITLFADPANLIKSQLDMLSYLITGQPSTQLSAASIELLVNAASNLSDKQTSISQFISKVQKKIGIDQLTIGSKPIFNPNTNSIQQNTSLIVGKNISPKLNVSYSLGLTDPISILQINYLLTKNFSLQTTSSNFANGIDLLYKIEKY